MKHKDKRPKAPSGNHRSKTSRFILGLFAVSMAAYLLTRLGLNSYNTQLSIANQKLTDAIAQTQTEIDELQVEVNLLQEKTRVLSMLDNQVSDNQDNIYVIDNN